MLSPAIQSLLLEARDGGSGAHRALGRLIRLVDDADPVSEAIDQKIMSSAFRAARIGLTGPPGGGKSSLIAAAIEILSASGLRIGILAVDPTSPFTGGALLGDRIRLKGPIGPNVFFRSLASRGALGGVSRAIWPASRLLDWWGADMILIETVGSGQLGTGVADVSELVIAVLTPESGDGIQSMKAGVMELADCFVVNKSDRPGSDLMLKELRLVQEEALAVGRSVEVFNTNALDGEGIEEGIKGLKKLYSDLHAKGEIDSRRKAQAKREVAFRTEAHLRARVSESLGGADSYETALSEWADKILSGEATPGEAAAELAGS